jgi:ribonucleoside-triphosphate reductase
MIFRLLIKEYVRMSVQEREMRTLEAIEEDLRETRKTLANVEGRDAEVYSRIVGYYRSVRNWNKGKKEEFGERTMFALPASAGNEAAALGEGFCVNCRLPADTDKESAVGTETAGRSVSTKGNAGPEERFADAHDSRILLFVRPECPSCPGAKAEAGKLVEHFGVTIETVDADTEAGLAKARKLGVTATPTAILLRGNAEVSRAKDRDGIAKLGAFFEQAKQSA